MDSEASLAKLANGNLVCYVNYLYQVWYIALEKLNMAATFSP